MFPVIRRNGKGFRQTAALEQINLGARFSCEPFHKLF
jgi:hypothetical protein